MRFWICMLLALASVAAAQEPTVPELLERAAALEKSGDVPGAIAAWQRATELDPKNVDAHEALVRAFGRRGNMQAMFHLGRVAEADPKRAEALGKELEAMVPSPAASAAADPQALEKARAAYDAGRYDEVRTLLEPLSRGEDFPKSARFILGMSYCKLRDMMNAKLQLMAMGRPREKLGFELEAEIERLTRSTISGMVAGTGAAAGNIHEAASLGDLGEVKKILAARPEARDEKDERGQPVLDVAVKAGQVEVVRALISAGASPNTTAGNQQHILIRAIPFGSLDVVKALVEGGADVNAIDGDGMFAKSALQEAEEAAKMRLVTPEIAAYLRSKGANSHRAVCSQRRDRIESSVRSHNMIASFKGEPEIKDRLDFDALVAKRSLKPEETRCPGDGIYRWMPGAPEYQRVQCSTHGVNKARAR